MDSLKDWNHIMSILVIDILVMSSPQAVADLVATPIGIAVIVLALASVTADSPALGILSLALVITEKEEVESFASEEAQRELDRFKKVRKHLISSCEPDSNGNLVYKDATGNVTSGSKATAALRTQGIRLGKGCDVNPCSEKCHAEL